MKVRNCTKCDSKLTHNEIARKHTICRSCRDDMDISRRITEIESKGYKVLKLERGNRNKPYPCEVECINCGKARTTYYRNIVKDGRKCSCKHNEARRNLIDSIQIKPVLIEVGVEFKKSGIYKITVGEEFYVGSSNNMQHRLRSHVRNIRDKKHTIPILKACEKYGTDSIKLEILEECEINELTSREQYYIDTLKPTLNILEDAENPMQDIKLKFAKLCGENNVSSKYSNEKVLEVARLLVDNRDMKEVARLTNVGWHTVVGISAGKSQQWIKDIDEVLYNRIMMMKGSRVGYTTIVEILEKLVKGEQMKSIAKEYNVNEKTVSNIKRREGVAMKRIKEQDKVVADMYTKLNEAGGER